MIKTSPKSMNLPYYSTDLYICLQIFWKNRYLSYRSILLVSAAVCMIFGYRILRNCAKGQAIFAKLLNTFGNKSWNKRPYAVLNVQPELHTVFYKNIKVQYEKICTQKIFSSIKTRLLISMEHSKGMANIAYQGGLLDPRGSHLVYMWGHVHCWLHCFAGRNLYQITWGRILISGRLFFQSVYYCIQNYRPISEAFWEKPKSTIYIVYMYSSTGKNKKT